LERRRPAERAELYSGISGLRQVRRRVWRGDGFARVVGADADIGAFEWQGGIDDPVFTSGFERGCVR